MSHALDIAVIGAGPAGSVAAIRLAQFGHRVTLFEKARFPRDKVCGECLSATGIAVLRRLRLAEAPARDSGPLSPWERVRVRADDYKHDATRSGHALTPALSQRERESSPSRDVAKLIQGSLSPAALLRTRAVSADGSAVELALPEPMWGLTRQSMDDALAACAAAAGADLRFETTATLFPCGTGFQPMIRSTRITTPCLHEEHPFDFVLLADGHGRALGKTAHTGDFGIKAHFRDVDAARDTIELIALDQGYAGLAPVNGNLWNAAWSVPAESLRRHRGDVDALFHEEVRRSPSLHRRFAHATRVSEWLTCPLPRYAVRRDWPPNVIPLGNAAAAIEPVGGEGMGLAMRSAELAADAIDAAARDHRPLNARVLRRQFEHLWRTRRAACRAGAVMLSHPIGGPLAVGVAARAPMLARAGLALIGK